MSTEIITGTIRGTYFADRDDVVIVAEDAIVRGLSEGQYAAIISRREPDNGHVTVVVEGRISVPFSEEETTQYGVLLTGLDDPLPGEDRTWEEPAQNTIHITATGVVRASWGVGCYLGSGNTILNEGHIHGFSTGMYLEGPNSEMTNAGLITGRLAMHGYQAHIISNTGTIRTEWGMALTYSSEAQISNTGRIHSSFGSGMDVSQCTNVGVENTGVIHSSGARYAAVELYDSENVTFTNSGRLIGLNGVIVFDSDVAMLNSGTIAGNTGILVDAYWEDTPFELVNSGRIVGQLFGLSVRDVTAMIENDGVISGGVVIHGDRSAEIVNTGRILGSVSLGEGDDTYVGTGGRVSGVVQGGEGDDRLVGGEVSDVLRGGADDDVLIGAGGADQLRGQGGSDLLRGGAGADDLSGGSGDDILNGGDGDDRLDGGRGDDLLRGQAGADVFVFGASSGTDHIAGFEQGIDRIEISDHVGGFAGLTLTPAGGAVVVEHDGGVIHVQGVAALTEADFVFL
ncbi:hypothetical protein LCL97_05705 [Seohaeicola saemankumensis]|nr:calcium-binding protein [Seohaeicola saemankumensis]MCA0870308.1 hypothetical protein [Seohaeicola saemankumensis]